MPVYVAPPETSIDCYKFDHRRQYPKGTEIVDSNWTARGSRLPGVDWTLWWGLQAVLMDLQHDWDVNFFNVPRSVVAERFQARVDGMLGPNDIGVDHILALHDLGYLPLEFRALPEGTKVPLRVPLMTVENTLPEFFWLVNYLESHLSTSLWQGITSATIALDLREMLDDFANRTSDTPEMVDFQMHDFSYRGMSSPNSAYASAAGHLLSFAGTDTVPALGWLETYYRATGPIGLSVPATEHSVMCAGGEMTEEGTFRRLLELYPTGIVSVVSDTWDLWHVLTEILPSLREEIMQRDGKLVIRPDSGNPADILCGDPNAGIKQPAYKGVIELLWETFGGTVNSKGYKELDPHIGAIYGDSITKERAREICSRLEEMGFSTTNVVFGVGSFTYQYNTRDTFGFAMKATWAQVEGEGRNLFKDPVTDDGLKKSATGRLAVIEMAGKLVLVEKAPDSLRNSPENLLQPVWCNGAFITRTTWENLQDRIGKRVIR